MEFGHLLRISTIKAWPSGLRWCVFCMFVYCTICNAKKKKRNDDTQDREMTTTVTKAKRPFSWYDVTKCYNDSARHYYDLKTTVYFCSFTSFYKLN